MASVCTKFPGSMHRIEGPVGLKSLSPRPGELLPLVRLDNGRWHMLGRQKASDRINLTQRQIKVLRWKVT